MQSYNSATSTKFGLNYEFHSRLIQTHNYFWFINWISMLEILKKLYFTKDNAVLSQNDNQHRGMVFQLDNLQRSAK